MEVLAFLLLWEGSNGSTIYAARLIDQVPCVPARTLTVTGHFLYGCEWNKKREDELCRLYRQILRQDLSLDQLRYLEALMVEKETHFIFHNDVLRQRLGITDDQLKRICEEAQDMAGIRPGYCHPGNMAFDREIEQTIVHTILSEEQRVEYRKIKQAKSPRCKPKSVLTGATEGGKMPPNLGRETNADELDSASRPVSSYRDERPTVKAQLRVVHGPAADVHGSPAARHASPSCRSLPW